MTDQLARSDLASMSAAEIDQARLDGRLAVVMGTYTPTDAHLVDRAKHGDVTRADVAALARLGRHDLLAGLNPTTIKE